MTRFRTWEIRDTEYPAVRRVMGPRRDVLDDPALEHLLAEILPGAEPGALEGFMQNMQRFGKQAAPLAQRALPGAIQGATQGAMVGGPYGAIAGAIGGGAMSALAPSTPASPRSSPPSALAMRTPSAAATITAPAAGAPPATASDPAMQLLALLSRPETIQALLALLLTGVGRTSVQVGGRQVPAAAFANAIAETAAILAQRGGSDLQSGLSEDLVDDHGTFRCDVANPLERAIVLMSDLAEVARAEAVEDASTSEDESESCAASTAWIDEEDPLEGYEDGLNGRGFEID